MTNIEIVANEAVASGYYTKDKIIEMLEKGDEIPFHSFSTWRSRGMVPRKGEHGWLMHLWKPKSEEKDLEDDNVNDNEENRFILCKCYLFDISQCEPLKEV